VSEIRAFAEEHVGEVAALFLRVMRGRREAPGAALQDYFREIFFSNPWASADLPSLVYLSEGAVAGFLGVVPRPMEFREKPIRAAVATQFMVDRERYRGPAAFELLNRFFAGPQELSFTDGAAEATHPLWSAAGGWGAPLYSFNWLRVLRPLGTARGFAGRTTGFVRLASRLGTSLAAPLDFVLSRVPHEALRPPFSNCIGRPADAASLFERIRETPSRDQLRPAYDRSSFEWLLSQAARARRNGDLRMATVHTPDGSFCGWYICYTRPRGAGTLLQIGVRRRDQFDAVLRTFFQEAWEQGCAFAKGQALPNFLVNLSKEYCLFRMAMTSTLFHTRDSQLKETILSGQAALSRLDGECWLRFAVEDW